MSLITWADSRIKTFTIFDFGILKICLFAFALLIAKIWPTVLTLDWYWYGIIFGLSYAWLVSRILTKRRA